MKKVILVNCLLVLTGLFLLELFFGSWFSQTPPLYRFIKPKNVHKTYVSSFAGQPANTTYTIDKYGFRGLDKALDEIFIVTVGGSTTDQKYIDDKFTYEAWLQRFFEAEGRNVDIVSAGIDGQSTYGHLKNFPYWFEKLPQFRPRYILYYVGVNDFYILRELPGFDAMEKRGFKAALRNTQSYLKENSALYAAGTVIISLISPPDVAHFRSDKPPAWSTGNWTTQSYVRTFRTPKVQESLLQLKGRISELAERTRKLGATPIFVTQRSVNWIEHEGKIWGRKGPLTRRHADALADMRKLSGVDYYWLERMQASAIMEACHASSGICIDLAGAMKLDHVAHFYDAAHTTPAGSKRIAEFLYPKLRDLL